MTTIGIYEKALPTNLDWLGRLKLAKKLGFSFVELSIDESDQRLARLKWSQQEREELRQASRSTGVQLKSICLSGHRRFPLGSADSEKQAKALQIMEEAIKLAVDLGVRVIQLAGYDVYYEEKTVQSREAFIRNLQTCVSMAASNEVVLALEIMDDPFLCSISKFLQIREQISSPYLQVYPDLGNLSAWPENDVGAELEKGIPYIMAVHLKDTLPVTATSSGQFKNVPFGAGCVDFVGCLATLQRLKYAGPFLIEMWCGDSPTAAEDIQAAQAFLYPLLREAGYEVDLVSDSI